MSLPADGTRVTGSTYPSLEYDRPAEQVTGVLATRSSPFGGPPQCLVGGMPVDPATVRPAEDDTSD